MGMLDINNLSALNCPLEKLKIPKFSNKRDGGSINMVATILESYQTRDDQPGNFVRA